MAKAGWEITDREANRAKSERESTHREWKHHERAEPPHVEVTPVSSGKPPSMVQRDNEDRGRGRGWVLPILRVGGRSKSLSFSSSSFFIFLYNNNNNHNHNIITLHYY